ncbi:MAG: hypothetical protein ABSE59_11830 [Opitutaceae bacterium]
MSLPSGFQLSYGDSRYAGGQTLAKRRKCRRITVVITIQEIESAIQKLPDRDVARLTHWLDEYAEAQLDRRIESDAKSGALNPLIEEAKTARKNGQVPDVPPAENDRL